VARDAAGNRATSAPVSVTVFNDTTPPTVAITSPGPGATVSGAITVTASATDAGGVTVVQVLVDGRELARDFASPYQAAWDTRTVGNGEHTLQARAQDTAGNIGDSPVVRVNVANTAPPPPPPPPPPPSGQTRFEETAATLAPAGAWSELTSASAEVPLSGGRAVFTDTARATATFTFTGTGVSWLGLRCETCGIASVRLDGTQATVDTFAPRPRSAGVVFQRSGLAPGSHTLVIEVTGDRNPSSGGMFIVVDAFEVTGDGGAPPPPPSTTVTRFQETHPSIQYSPEWLHGRTSRQWSGGTASATAVGGQRATFTFTGPSVSWIGFKSREAGIARVSLDGIVRAEALDLYSPTEEVRLPVFTATGLGNTTHTLTIEVTGTKNPAAINFFIVVDAFDVPAPSVTRVQETDAAIRYEPTGAWVRDPDPGKTWSQGAAMTSSSGGARATFTFTGTSVGWVGIRHSAGGLASVFLDGVFQREVDFFRPGPDVDRQAEVWRSPELESGSHTLTIEVTGRSNPASVGREIAVDAFDVTR
jgi:hypothetical protein